MTVQKSANVTLENDLKDLKQSIPCFLCHEPVEIRRDKNQKYYFICDKCGIQAFIRRKSGIRLLEELRDKAFSSLDIIQLTRELSLLKRGKDKITSQQGLIRLFAADEELIKAEMAINQKIKEISRKIKELTEKGGRRG